jgi:MarR family transcriptional regulator for hemolysin
MSIDSRSNDCAMLGGMPPPLGPPIGLTLTSTARTVSRAFDDALAAAGGSLPTWQILIALETGRPDNQRELAAAVGIQGATLTHHLNAMETAGLLTRRRNPENRRVHMVELTEAGTAAFHRLRTVAIAFDHQLRTGLSDAEIATLGGLLQRLRRNVGGPTSVDTPWGPQPGGEPVAAT